MGSPRPMYCEEEDDETGRPLKGTRRSASVKPTKEKTKERPKITTRDRTPSKASKPNSDWGYSTGAVPTGSETSSTVKNVEYTTESKKQRRQSMSQRRPSVAPDSRPPQTLKNKENKEHRRSLSVKTDVKPEHFGIPTPVSSRNPHPPVITQPLTTPVALRPRALTHAQTYSGTRPSSYHAASTTTTAYPPLSNSAYFQQPSHQPVHQPAPFQAPPPSPAYNYAVVHTPQSAAGYFPSQEVQTPSRSLHSRFEPQRTLSAYGIRDEPSSTPRMITAAGAYEREYHYSEDGYDSYESSVDEPASIRRTTSSSIRVPSRVTSRTSSQAVSESNFSKANSTYSRESNYSELESGYNKSKSKSRGRRESDAKAMPPPPLPSTSKSMLRRPTVEIPVYNDNASIYSEDYSLGREEYHEEPTRTAPRPRRPSAHRNSVSYDVSELPREAEKVRIEAASKSRRRQSYYGQSASSTQASSSASSGYDAKLSAAANYLEEISGPTIPLTAEALRKEQKRQAGGSSRSTKSSGSRDLSDYRGTQTTRTTRSGGDDGDNVTIEVTGQAKVTVGGAEIQCEEGGKIQIHRKEKIRDGGSQATASEYGHGPKLLDDRRSRIDRAERQTTGSRMSSQHSYTAVSPRPSDRDRAPRERREDYEARAANWV